MVLGNHQTKDTFNAIKSPTARSASAKLLISLQAKLNLFSCVLDVKGAYLKSTVKKHKKENLYIQLPDGSYAKLNKYMYGLKQAGKEWHDNLSGTLVNGGYSMSSADPCVFSRWYDDDYIIMVTHVDDFYVVSNKQHLIDDLYNYLIQEYDEVTVKSGDVIGYLGMEIRRNSNTGEIKLCQPGYVEKILKEVKLEEASYCDTPWPIHIDDKRDDLEFVNKNEYLRLLGLLNYLAIFTRPDILFALSKAAQKCTEPNAGDMKRLRRIFRYVGGTKDYGITFNADDDVKLYAYVDASHNCYDDGKGHYGLCFTLGKNDGAFYARSNKLKLVTLSSTESEYVAMCEASTEVVFLRRLLEDIGFKQDEPTIIFEDNKSCIDMIHGLSNHQRSKHINPKYHFTREQVKLGEIAIEYIRTEEMTADILTKSLPRGVFDKLAKKIINYKKQTKKHKTSRE